MATILLEGFDDYGPPSLTDSTGSDKTIPSLDTQLAIGNWGVISGTVYIATGLNEIGGYALKLVSPAGGADTSIYHVLPQNFSRIMGGFRFASSVSFTTDSYAGILWYDNATVQCSLYISSLTGELHFYLGDKGILTATALLSIDPNSVHYIEFDITFGLDFTSGFSFWFDGVRVIWNTGQTEVDFNNYCNGIGFKTFAGASGVTQTMEVDDLYIVDNTTAENNSVLLSMPCVLTQDPIADASIQFTNIDNAFGNLCGAAGSNYSLAANSIYLIAFVPNVNCTANDIVIGPQTTSAGAKFRGVLYADSSGVAGARLTSGTEVTGCTAGTPLTLPLTTPQALTAGTKYWFGLINDTTINLAEFDTTTLGSRANNTYASGAPTPAPAMTTGQASVMLYVIASGAATNWESVALNPSVDDNSCLEQTTVGSTDLYKFPVVPLEVARVYSVGVSVDAKLTAAGSHTIKDLVLSQAVEAAGAAKTLTTSYIRQDSYFDVDPNTSQVWLVPAVSGSMAGLRIES